MLRRRSVDDAASATLEHIEEVLRARAPYVSDHAVADERFADVAASQLLTLIPAELRARSTWSGYGGTAVARRLLDSFYANWNQWEPTAALSVADAALAIAQSSDRRTPALLFRAHAARATVLSVQSDFDEAFASLADAEEHAADTKSRRLHFAVLANHRAGGSTCRWSVGATHWNSSAKPMKVTRHAATEDTSGIFVLFTTWCTSSPASTMRHADLVN